MQLRMELETRQNEISFEMNDRSFDQKNLKKDFEQAQLVGKKASGEVQWLQTQNLDLKAKLKAADEENDILQDKLLELKSNYMNGSSQGNDYGAQGLEL